METIEVEPHPLLDAAAFSVALPAPLGELAAPAAWSSMLRLRGAGAPLASDDGVRREVRDLLRHGGYKPTGRGKPAAEYLLRAEGEERLAAINLVVDACNIVSLHSGLPISLIDRDRASGRLSIRMGRPAERYVFNPAGQEIDLGGLLCLCDAAGPCANAVKDAQRTKTDADTRNTLTVIWGTSRLPGRTAATLDWYREVLADGGLEMQPVTLAHRDNELDGG